MRARIPEDPRKERIVDKMLRNLWNIGYIQMMLPNSCIIHAVRTLSQHPDPFPLVSLPLPSRGSRGRCRPISSPKSSPRVASRAPLPPVFCAHRRLRPPRLVIFLHLCPQHLLPPYSNKLCPGPLPCGPSMRLPPTVAPSFPRPDQVRHPIDTAISCYEQPFEGRGTPWAWDLEEISEYIMLSHAIANHWDLVSRSMDLPR